MRSVLTRQDQGFDAPRTFPKNSLTGAGDALNVSDVELDWFRPVRVKCWRYEYVVASILMPPKDLEADFELFYEGVYQKFGHKAALLVADGACHANCMIQI